MNKLIITICLCFFMGFGYANPFGEIALLPTNLNVVNLHIIPTEELVLTSDSVIFILSDQGLTKNKIPLQQADRVIRSTLSNDSSMILIGTQKGFAMSFHVTSGRWNAKKITTDKICTIVSSPLREEIYMGSSTGMLYVTNNAFDVVQQKNIHDGLISSLSLNPDGSILASASFDGTCKLTLLDSYDVKILTNSTTLYTVVSFSPQGDKLLIAGKKRCQIYQRKSKDYFHPIKTTNRHKWPTSIVWCDDNKSWIVGEFSGKITIHTPYAQYLKRGKNPVNDILYLGGTDIRWLSAYFGSGVKYITAKSTITKRKSF